MKFLLVFLIKFLLKAVIAQRCQDLVQPRDGFVIGGYCSNSVESICGIKCRPGFTLYGSSFRKCQIINNETKWSGEESLCIIKQCKPLDIEASINTNCTEKNINYGTICHFSCPNGFYMIGSSIRICLAVGFWSGLNTKCVEGKHFQHITTSTRKPQITSTQYKAKYNDLTQFSIKFGYSFKKISLNVEIVELPINFGIWLRTNYTKNIKIINYFHSCFNVSILSNEDSNVIISFSIFKNQSFSNVTYLFNSNKYLTRNEWTQIILAHSEQNFRVFINGVPEFSLQEINHILNQSLCKEMKRENQANQFRIVDDLNTQKNDFFQPMRGEITRVYLYNFELTEEEILFSFFKCHGNLANYNQSLVIFEWSNVLIDKYLADFKRMKTNFCKNCKEPLLIKHAFMYYDGTGTGDVLLYECQKEFTIVGESTSVCMIYGSWSHKTPRCKAIPYWMRNSTKTSGSINVQQNIMERLFIKIRDDQNKKNKLKN